MIRQSFFAQRALFATLTVIVTYLTVTPNPDQADAGFALTRWIANMIFGNSSLGDKVAHFAAYGLLGFSAYFARLLEPRRVIAVPVSLALYGALLEGVQGLGGVRSPELADAIANSLGAICGFAAARLTVATLKTVRR